MHLYDYTDYRVYLKEQAESVKASKPFFSYRFIATKLGINAGLVARIFNGQTHLTLKHVNPMAKLFALKGKELDYFNELVRFCRAKTQKDWDHHFTRMQSIRGEEFRTVADDQIAYYSSWQHNAMRTLLSLIEFKGKDYKRLGSMLVPAITAQEAKQSLDLLVSLGLAHQNERGVFEVPDRFISTGEAWKATIIRQFQQEMVKKSLESLNAVPSNLRDISTLTIPLTRTMVEPMRERIREFRQEMLAMARECESEDSVYQLNVQLFPIALISVQGGPR